MPASPDPALARFVAELSDEQIWVQAWIGRRGEGFELRHVMDRSAASEGLREIQVDDLRELAQWTEALAFRPLKAAPTLVSGWRCLPAGAVELGRALHHLYPGGVGDWYALHTGTAGAVEFSDVAARQLGRARVLEELRGPALHSVVDATCEPGSCLKRRCWTAEGMPAEDGSGKSILPCLEPCPLFMRFARACALMERGATVSLRFAPDDLSTIAAALRHALDHRPPGLRLGEVSVPLHPWRVMRLLARWQDAWSQVGSVPDDSDE